MRTARTERLFLSLRYTYAFLGHLHCQMMSYQICCCRTVMYVLQIVLSLLRKNVDIHIILTSTFKGHLCLGLPAYIISPALRHIYGTIWS